MQESFPLKVIISGPPASGKGTQCANIVTKYGLVHLSTGDMLREVARSGSEVGKKVKEIMSLGQIKQEDCKKKGFLLDGFPRTLPQAKFLLKNTEIDCFILLKVPDAVLIERAVGRLLHRPTGKIYHIKFFPPPKEIEKECIKRADDTESAMTRRLKSYHKNVASVEGAFNDCSVEINGNRKKDAVWADIVDSLDASSKLKAKH